MRRRKSTAAARAMSVTVKLSPQEYHLLSYAASKSRARGVQAWMRDRLLEAARAKVPEKTAAQILAGSATVELLRESLGELQRGKPARVLPFKPARHRA
jgi:hypothetical protein